MDRSSLIGRRFQEIPCTIARSHVEEFSEVMDENWDPRNESTVPLCYTPLLAMQAIERGIDLEEDLLVSQQQDTVMFGELELEFHGPLRMDAELTAELEIDGVQTKQGESGEFEIITIGETFRDSGGDLRLEASISAIVAEGG